MIDNNTLPLGAPSSFEKNELETFTLSNGIIVLNPPKYVGSGINEPKSISVQKDGDQVSQLVEASRFNQLQFQAVCEHVAGIEDAKHLTRIWNAYSDLKAVFAFEEAKRISGEDYYQHPKAVALIDMLEFGNKDWKLVIAELHHDSPEDSLLFHGNKSFPGKSENHHTIATVDALAIRYGKKVAKILDAVCKPKPLTPKEKMTQEQKYDYTKMVHIRVLIAYQELMRECAQVKSVDRIQNMRTEPISDNEKMDERWEERLVRRIIETHNLILPIAEIAGEQYVSALKREINEKREILTLQQKKLRRDRDIVRLIRELTS